MVLYADIYYKISFIPPFLNYSCINHSFFFLSHRCMIRDPQGIQGVREVYPLSVINSMEVVFCFIILYFFIFFVFSR